MLHLRSWCGVLCLFALLAASAQGAAATGQQRAAVFDFELIDSSLGGQMNGPVEAESVRLAGLGEQLREAFARSNRYELVDIAPVEKEARAHNLQGCRGCDVELAKRLGADLAVTGTVQKVSNLILNINVYVRDVATGKLVQAMSADIRGNTDQSWRKGLEWLIRNRLQMQ